MSRTEGVNGNVPSIYTHTHIYICTHISLHLYTQSTWCRKESVTPCSLFVRVANVLHEELPCFDTVNMFPCTSKHVGNISVIAQYKDVKKHFVHFLFSVGN